MREGMSREEATRAARRAFGNAALIEERGREAWQWPRLESLLADAKFALRQLRRSPGFAVTAVLTLALGIGANTAIFTLIDSIMLRPLPYPQQERLVRLSGTDEQGRPSAYFPKGWIRAWQEHSQSFDSISGYAASTESNVTGNDQSERVFGSAVTVNTFDTLGHSPGDWQLLLAGECRQRPGSGGCAELRILASALRRKSGSDRRDGTHRWDLAADHRRDAVWCAFSLCRYAVSDSDCIQGWRPDRPVEGFRVNRARSDG